MAKKLICLLGGAGFIGQNLTQHLTEAGFAVRIPTRKRERVKKDLIVHPTVDVIEANVMDQSSLDTVTSGCDIVINLVGVLNETKGESFINTHVDFPRQIISACKKNSITRLIHLSAIGVSSEAPSKYLKSKWQGEEAIKLGSQGVIKTTILRPSIVFGDGDSFINLFVKIIALSPLIPLVKSDALLQPIYVGNVSTVVTKILDSTETGGKTYELGGPKIYTFKEILNIICLSQKRRRVIIPMPSVASTMIARFTEKFPLKILTRDNLLSLTIDNTTSQNFSTIFNIKPESLESYLQEKFQTVDQYNRKAKRRSSANR